MSQSPSMTGRLIGALIVPMVILGLALGIGAAISVRRGVTAVSDTILLASARAISESLAVEDKEITLDMPPSAFAMLDSDAHDSVYYAIHHSGNVITGYPDLPRIGARTLFDGQHEFVDEIYRGHTIRLVAEARRLPQVDGLVVVEVGETTGGRELVSSHILWVLTGLETALIALTLVLIPLAIYWGLHPLLKLRRSMDGRSPSDFTPISLEQAPSEMRDLVASFNSLMHRLEATVEGVRRFGADASHQMRTPLSVLRSHVAVLQRAKIKDDTARSSILDIDMATTRLERLVTQFLALGRAENSTPTSVAFDSEELQALAQDVTSGFALMASRAGVNLAFESSAVPVWVSTQKALAGELIANVVDNAIRYNRSGGHVIVSTLRQDNIGRVIVEDDGPGIDPEDREKAFLRFIRLHGDPLRKGSGLGLSIARALCLSLQAEIRLRSSSLGQGLRVEIDFPLR